MKLKIPLLLMPQKQALVLAHPFLSISSRLLKRNNVPLVDMPNDFARDRRRGYDINVGGPHTGG